jgi:hypothetical protein
MVFLHHICHAMNSWTFNFTTIVRIFSSEIYAYILKNLYLTTMDSQSHFKFIQGLQGESHESKELKIDWYVVLFILIARGRS